MIEWNTYCKILNKEYLKKDNYLLIFKKNQYSSKNMLKNYEFFSKFEDVIQIEIKNDFFLIINKDSKNLKKIQGLLKDISEGFSIDSLESETNTDTYEEFQSKIKEKTKIKKLIEHDLLINKKYHIQIKNKKNQILKFFKESKHFYFFKDENNIIVKIHKKEQVKIVHFDLDDKNEIIHELLSIINLH